MPTRFHTRKHVRFVDLPRHKRRNAVIRLGWKIARQAGGFGFWTDQLLEDPEDPHRIHRWVDVYFLGADRFTLWNAEFITIALAVEDALHDRAFKAAYAGLSAEKIECERLEAHYLATEPPVIGERFVTDRGYAYGIGLHAVVRESTLDRAAIERTIQRFRDMGERYWHAALDT
jgi:hypothetical protein